MSRVTGVNETQLGSLVVARDAQGNITAVGVAQTLIDAPTVVIVTPSGRVMSRRADMCEVIAEEAIAAWLQLDGVSK